MKKIKVLFFGELPPMAINGVSISNKLNIDLLARFSSVELAQEVTSLSAKGLSKISNILKSFHNLYNKLKSCKYDFLYLSFPTSVLGLGKMLCAIRLFRLFNTNSQVVSHLHRGDLLSFAERSQLARYLVLSAINLCDKVLVLSPSYIQKVEEKLPIKKGVLDYMPNGIEGEGSTESNISESHSCAGSYLYLSNYIEAKGYQKVIDCFKSLKQCTLKMFGSETESGQLKRINGSVTDNIMPSGSVSGYEKSQALDSSKAIILMSENEGLPLVILEAMSKGKLVITTNVGFIEEALGADYPYYVENDADALKEAVLSIESLSKVEYEALANTLRDRFNAGFSSNTRLEKLKALFLNTKI